MVVKFKLNCPLLFYSTNVVLSSLQSITLCPHINVHGTKIKKLDKGLHPKKLDNPIYAAIRKKIGLQYC